MTSSDSETPSQNSNTPDSADERKPFVEPTLRRETDLVGGTAERDFFGTSSMS
jgi:hypothetical protein